MPEAEALTIKGNLTIREAGEIKEKFVKVLKEKSAAKVDLSEVNECDTAGAQLLLAFKKEAAKENLKIRFVNHSEAVLHCLDLYGLIGLLADPIRVKVNERQKYNFNYGTNRQSIS